MIRVTARGRRCPGVGEESGEFAVVGGAVAGLRSGIVVRTGGLGFEGGEFLVALGRLLAQRGQPAQSLGAGRGSGTVAGEVV
ncbi:hypothetical protein OG478_42055 [Streptomyces phaeochromogenes]|uniref:hypothetical protein n=1 Tax=Streptomyces phaeochromogenes TaxID=1923 RepID=UPI0038668FCC|nr:hypothetical protein OG478_42055 [Streptomyces phaeochromogenes]